MRKKESKETSHRMENVNWYLRVVREAGERAFWGENRVWVMAWASVTLIFRSQSPSDNEGQLYREEDVLGRIDSITVEDIPDEGDKFIHE